MPPARRAGLFSKCPAGPSRRAKTRGRLELGGRVRASRKRGAVLRLRGIAQAR